ncbi:MAG: signal recognition particle-docking protein FtsY [Thermoplasmata archaeon]
MFEKLKEKLGLFSKKAKEELPEDAFTDGFGKKITGNKLNSYLDNLELGLIDADVAYDAAEALKKKLMENIANKKFKRGLDLESTFTELLKQTIFDIFNENKFNFKEYVKSSTKPLKILFVGVNGTGKTTSIAKLAKWLSLQGYSVVIAASDTFRAGAIEQLEIHSEKLNIRLIKHQHGSDSAAVAFDAISHAVSRSRDVVLIDTAGRMQTNKNLMNEMKKLKRVAKPDFTIFVGDALAGNDAINQAKLFNEEIGIDGIILSKIDTDAKGGSAISIVLTLNKPILFLGTGQNYEDLIEFDPKWIINHIFNT